MYASTFEPLSHRGWQFSTSPYVVYSVDMNTNTESMGPVH